MGEAAGSIVPSSEWGSPLPPHVHTLHGHLEEEEAASQTGRGAHVASTPAADAKVSAGE